MKKILAVLLVTVLAMGFALANGTTENAGGAEQWPSGKNIDFIVPAKAGGGTDLMVRYITEAWKNVLGTNIVVTNYETSEVGSRKFSEAKPNGMTLSLAACTNMDIYLSGASDVNPYDFTVISQVTAGNPQCVITNKDAPYNNMQELKEYALKHPGEVIVGCSLGGTSQLMWINIADSMGGIKLNYVQSPNEADKLTNVSSGAINLGNASMNNAMDYEASGKIKILGIVSYSDKVGKNDIDSKLGNQYLTTWEQGFPGSSFFAGNYVVGPKGMSDETAKAINESLLKIAGEETFKAGMQRMRQVVSLTDVATARDAYKNEWELQKRLTTSAGINVR